jgi:hypothetical protein
LFPTLGRTAETCWSEFERRVGKKWFGIYHPIVVVKALTKKYSKNFKTGKINSLEQYLVEQRFQPVPANSGGRGAFGCLFSKCSLKAPTLGIAALQISQVNATPPSLTARL